MARLSAPSVIESAVTEAEELEDPMANAPSTSVLPLASPTLEQAFTLLCRALIHELDENPQTQLHVEEIMGWFENKNHAIAWSHALLILEGVLGVPLLPR